MTTSSTTIGDLFPQWLESPELSTMNLKGKDYLVVAQRVIWFQADQRRLQAAGLATHPVKMVTNLLAHDPEKEGGWALYETTVQDCLGGVYTMQGSESKKDFPDYMEKASTKSLGRALASAGYGTLAMDAFGDETADGRRERPVDAPAERKGSKVEAKGKAETRNETRAEATTKRTESASVAPAALRDEVVALVRQDAKAGVWMLTNFYPQYGPDHKFSENVTEIDALSFKLHYDVRLKQFQAQQAAEQARTEAEQSQDEPTPPQDEPDPTPPQSKVTPIRPNVPVQSGDAGVTPAAPSQAPAQAAAVDEEDDAEFEGMNHGELYAYLKELYEPIINTDQKVRYIQMLQTVVKRWGKEPGTKLPEVYTDDDLKTAIKLTEQWDLTRSAEENIYKIAPQLVERVQSPLMGS